MELAARPIEDVVEEALKAIGLEPRELLADPEKVDPRFKAALIEEIIAFIQGGKLIRGIGITGETGVGKTFAMVCILRAHMAAKVARNRREGTAQGKSPASLYRWLEWPAQVHWLRSNAVSNPHAVEAAVKAWSTIPVLILDDLGSERRKGDYQEDYACGELDFVISARYRACLPTLYTTNLDHAGLIRSYGARMVSRLCGEAPLVVLRGKDQRISVK